MITSVKFDGAHKIHILIRSGLMMFLYIYSASYHSGALTNQGDLLTWGANSNGAIGHGESNVFVEPKTIPEAIPSLRNMFVFAIGFGGWQSSALAIPRD